jgi:hypothetical protein
MHAAADELLLPRRLALALYAAAQARPDVVVRGRVLRGRAGLVFLPDGEHAEDPVFAAVRTRPEGTPPPDRVELEQLLESAPLVLVVSRATRGVMVLTGHRRAGGGIAAWPVRIEDAERGAV